MLGINTEVTDSTYGPALAPGSSSSVPAFSYLIAIWAIPKQKNERGAHQRTQQFK